MVRGRRAGSDPDGLQPRSVAAIIVPVAKQVTMSFAPLPEVRGLLAKAVAEGRYPSKGAAINDAVTRVLQPDTLPRRPGNPSGKAKGVATE